MNGQCKSILESLKSGESLTALDALQRFGCLRLAARISDLKAVGHEITTITETRNGQRFARYRLVCSQPVTLPPAFKPVARKEQINSLGI